MPRDSEASRKRRGEKWDGEFIPCKNHPDRRCSRSRYVLARDRECGSCRHTRKDGTLRQFHVTYDKSEQRKWKSLSAERLRRIKENRP